MSKKSFTKTYENVVDLAIFYTKKMKLNKFYFEEYDIIKKQIEKVSHGQYEKIIEKIKPEHEFVGVVKQFLYENYTFSCQNILSKFNVKIVIVTPEGKFWEEYVNFFDYENVIKVCNIMADQNLKEVYELLIPIFEELYENFYNILDVFCKKYEIKFPICRDTLFKVEEELFKVKHGISQNIKEIDEDIEKEEVLIEVAEDKINNEAIKNFKTERTRMNFQDNFRKYFTILNDAVVFKGENHELFKENFIDAEGYIKFKVKANPGLNLDIVCTIIRNQLNKLVEIRNEYNNIYKDIEALNIFEKWLEDNNKKISTKRSFKIIANKFKMPTNTVKTKWHKAYELIYGERYNPDLFKEKFKKELEESSNDRLTKAHLLCTKCKGACYDDPDAIPCAEFFKIAPEERANYRDELSLNPNYFETYSPEISKAGRRSQREAKRHTDFNDEH
ncbi:MAG: hypothetical protein QMC67_13235 [Candidatus Wallbacteria bacterium]